MKTKTDDLLPKILPGTVHTQFIRCGKKNCKCFRGELHGAYYYHFVRVNGKLRKRYLKPAEIENVQAACLIRQQTKRREIKNLKAAWTVLREIREQLRGVSEIYKN